jgi:hypothetical protein
VSSRGGEGKVNEHEESNLVPLETLEELTRRLSNLDSSISKRVIEIVMSEVAYRQKREEYLLELRARAERSRWLLQVFTMFLSFIFLVVGAFLVLQGFTIPGLLLAISNPLFTFAQAALLKRGSDDR